METESFYTQLKFIDPTKSLTLTYKVISQIRQFENFSFVLLILFIEILKIAIGIDNDNGSRQRLKLGLPHQPILVQLVQVLQVLERNSVSALFRPIPPLNASKSGIGRKSAETEFRSST